MTFAQFIATRRAPLQARTPRGDLINDCQTLINAGKFPEMKQWSDLYRFISGRNARTETIEEARRLWRQYRSTAPLEIAA